MGCQQAKYGDRHCGAYESHNVYGEVVLDHLYAIVVVVDQVFGVGVTDHLFKPFDAEIHLGLKMLINKPNWMRRLCL